MIRSFSILSAILILSTLAYSQDISEVKTACYVATIDSHQFGDLVMHRMESTALTEDEVRAQLMMEVKLAIMIGGMKYAQSPLCDYTFYCAGDKDEIEAWINALNPDMWTVRQIDKREPQPVQVVIPKDGYVGLLLQDAIEKACMAQLDAYILEVDSYRPRKPFELWQVRTNTARLSFIIRGGVVSGMRCVNK